MDFQWLWIVVAYAYSSVKMPSFSSMGFCRSASAYLHSVVLEPRYIHPSVFAAFIASTNSSPLAVLTWAMPLAVAPSPSAQALPAKRRCTLNTALPPGRGVTVPLAAHERYPQFFEHGDAEAYRQGLERLRRQLEEAREP